LLLHRDLILDVPSELVAFAILASPFSWNRVQTAADSLIPIHRPILASPVAQQCRRSLSRRFGERNPRQTATRLLLPRSTLSAHLYVYERRCCHGRSGWVRRTPRRLELADERVEPAIGEPIQPVPQIPPPVSQRSYVWLYSMGPTRVGMLYRALLPTSFPEAILMMYQRPTSQPPG
jgi:hypothetical protein